MYLKNIQYDQIYSSDLERALETANIISQNNLNNSTDINDIKQTKLLRERAFGIYDLTGKDDFIRIAKEAGFEDDEDFRPENGENGADCLKRCKEFMELLINSTLLQDQLQQTNKENRYCKFLIATHGGWIMRFLRLLNQYEITNPDLHCKDVKEYQSVGGKGIVNTAIFDFEFLVNTDNGKVISYNCTKCNSAEHLNGIK